MCVCVFRQAGGLKTHNYGNHMRNIEDCRSFFLCVSLFEEREEKLDIQMTTEVNYL